MRLCDRVCAYARLFVCGYVYFILSKRIWSYVLNWTKFFACVFVYGKLVLLKSGNTSLERGAVLAILVLFSILHQREVDGVMHLIKSNLLFMFLAMTRSSDVNLEIISRKVCHNRDFTIYVIAIFVAFHTSVLHRWEIRI